MSVEQWKEFVYKEPENLHVNYATYCHVAQTSLLTSLSLSVCLDFYEEIKWDKVKMCYYLISIKQIYITKKHKMLLKSCFLQILCSSQNGKLHTFCNSVVTPAERDWKEEGNPIFNFIMLEQQSPASGLRATSGP